MKTEETSERVNRFHEKILEKQNMEIAAELDELTAGPNYCPEFSYFLELFRGGISISAAAQRTGMPVAALLCVQTPLELVHAHGFHPFKIFSGSFATGQITAPHLPVLACPMLRSALGALEQEKQTDCPWIMPTTCDWVVQFNEIARLGGVAINGPVHRMELPCIKDSPRAHDRWLDEVKALSNFLVKSGGRRLNRKVLQKSIEIFGAARQCFARLIDLRRAGLVPCKWFFIITGSFFLDRIENWTAAVEKTLPIFRQNTTKGKRIFLAGSPIFFPNFKLPQLLEEAGLWVTGDDLCSSERIFPVNLAVSDPSEEGLLCALAETYHQGCLCPVFGDNERRINNIHAALPSANFKGLIFHILKGCHPYDLESFQLEEQIKEAGLRFLKVETDYTAEDSQNILTRLEAFGRTLGE